MVEGIEDRDKSITNSGLYFKIIPNYIFNIVQTNTMQ